MITGLELVTFSIDLYYSLQIIPPIQCLRSFIPNLVMKYMSDPFVAKPTLIYKYKSGMRIAY